MTRVDVWWARLADYSPALDRLLSTVETTRAARLRRPEDRVRQVLGAVMLRLAVGAEVGQRPEEVLVDRTCSGCAQPHGRPLLPGTGLHASITHSADVVGLALTRVAPLGLDVELVADIDTVSLSRSVLHESERAPDLPSFFTYWTRKESVTKATGEGLRAVLTGVRVSGPGEPPAVLAYPGRERLPAVMLDLDPGEGYKGALTVLTEQAVRVEERLGVLLLQ